MKRENVFLVSLIAMLAVTNVRADIASSAYVDAKVGPVEQALSGKQDVSNMVKATSGTGLTNNTTSTSKYPSMATASAMITAALSSTVTDVSTLQNTGVKHTASTAVGSETVPVYVASDGTATPITSYSGNAATATKATQDASGNVITTTYATKTELGTTNSNVAANTSAISVINNESTGILKTAKDYTDSQISGITTGENSINSRLSAAEGTISQHTDDISTLNSNKQAKLSEAQLNAANSGITSTKVGNYDTHIADGDIHVTAAQKTAWTAKQDAISDLSTIRSGAAAGATALQAADIVTGTANGTISVDGSDVSVKGLGTAAYTASTAYDASGAASAAETAAKDYTDTEVAKKQNKSTGVSVGGANGAWNTLANGNGITITTNNGTTTIATSGNYIAVPAATGTSGKSVLTYDADTTTYYWEDIGR